MKNLKKLFFLLTEQEQKKAIILMGMVFLMALTEVIGIASIMPFMGVLTNPEIINNNNFLNSVFLKSAIIGVETEQDFLIALGIVVFTLIVTSLLFKAYTTYLQTYFIHMSEYSISKRLLEGYLNQPYTWFINNNSSDVGASILSETSNVAGRGIKPMIILIAQSIVALTLIVLLLFIDPLLIILVVILFGSFFGLIYLFTRIFLNRIGKERLDANKSRFTIVNEGFGAFKELKLGSLEEVYIQRYSQFSKKYVLYTAWSQIIAKIPQYGVQIMAFGGLILITLHLMIKGGNFVDVIPTLTLFAFAGYRLMPAIQNIYISFSQLRFIGPTLDNLYNDMKNLKYHPSKDDKQLLSFNSHIKLKNIDFTYPNSSKKILRDIDIDIPINSTIGLVGTTGSGKTTVVDIILGLLKAQKGTLEVDDVLIDKKNLRSWQSFLGYVPQDIFLADDTITSNIALGVDLNKIDQEAVEQAAKIANLHNFIINELPQNYQTIIGEDGIKLSGGQRQRIGIARALYHNPKVLILDEATNSLDGNTEQAVMEAVYNMSGDKTIIMIAHRLSTVKRCDKIFLLKDGKLIQQGSFDELIKSNDNFKIPEIDK